MDAAKAPVDSSSHKNEDIDIFLFSNGQIFSPPRKYHLKGEELDSWDSTKNYLARSHYGFMHSSIDLYTTDGKKIDGPSELSDKTVYVAVEPNDSFLAGGYDQYLMKASKSWIKRYGDSQNINNNNKDNTEPHPETIPENRKTDDSVDGIEKTDESAKLITEASITNELLKEIERKKSVQKSNQRTSPQRNALSPKQTDKKIKPLQRSSILRKNITNIHSYDKNPPIPLQNKRNIYENPKKILPPKKPQQLKTPLSPQKSSRLSSQLTCDKSISNSTYVTPTIIIPTKLDIQNDTQTESSNDKKNQPQEDGITSNDDTKQENITLVKHESNQKDFGLETIIENIHIIRNDELKSNDTESKIIEPLTSFRNVGDVINLRLSIEVKNKTDTPTKRKGNVTVTIPLTTNEPWNGSKEKSSQVNMDEMGTQMEIINVVDDCSKNDTTSKYIIFNCDCHDFYHVPTKGPDENYHKLNYEVKNINNKDYILLLPSVRNDSDFFRCKCNDEPKVDKYAQTSFVIENIQCLNIGSNIQTVDQSNHAEKTTFNVNNVAHYVSVASVSDLQKSVTYDNPNNNNENHISSNKDHCPELQGKNTGNNKSTSTTKMNSQCAEHNSHKGNDLNLNKVFPKENQLSTEIYESANISNETAILDKSTQTDSHCFLLEARRQTDGHFSFHLPPLSMVKLYQM